MFVAPVAQLVEQRTLNPLVEGSSPSRCTIFINLVLILLYPVKEQNI